jgi:hypothetical protein
MPNGTSTSCIAVSRGRGHRSLAASTGPRSTSSIVLHSAKGISFNRRACRPSQLPRCCCRPRNVRTHAVGNPAPALATARLRGRLEMPEHRAAERPADERDTACARTGCRSNLNQKCERLWTLLGTAERSELNYAKQKAWWRKQPARFCTA